MDSASCAPSSTWSKAAATSALEDPSAAGPSVGALGVLGGTFNPPHVGHLALARTAASQLGLGRVLLIPARVPPHKAIEQDPGAEHRLRMCRLAVAGDERLGVCALELDRPGPSYTVDTLRAIGAEHPGVSMTLIVGADAARTLGSWREPREILRLARLAVAERECAERGDVLNALTQLEGERGTIFLDMPRMPVSSSIVRERIWAGEPIDELVGQAVASYISDQHLYCSHAERQLNESRA